MLSFLYQVKLQDDEVYIVNVRCNGAATILMAETGTLYAYGENNENRLGLGNKYIKLVIKWTQSKHGKFDLWNKRWSYFKLLILADDSWFVWPWTMYSSGNYEDVINVPTQIKSLKHRIGKRNRYSWDLTHYELWNKLQC